MPQRMEQLREAVRQLEAQLHTLEAVDDESRQLLEEARGEIQTVLAKGPHQPQPDTLVGRLETALGQFETSHPKLAGAIRQVIEGLGRMGI